MLTPSDGVSMPSDGVSMPSDGVSMPSRSRLGLGPGWSALW
ncbi:hypothetical protein PS726_02486 [Pseudomonas fluorescens]|nr:hypothetical protein PS726_02486 [Pseudomonas fluorescens]